MPYHGPAFLCFLKGQVRPPHDARHDPKRSLWPGTNRASVCFFPPAAVASRLGTVFSVEGAPENRAGKSLWPSIFLCLQLGSCVLGDQHAKVMCSPTDPFDQGVVATDEVKEEPPEPFQKIGPSMRDPGAKGWRGWGREAARATLLERQWLQPCNCVPACWLG